MTGIFIMPNEPHPSLNECRDLKDRGKNASFSGECSQVTARIAGLGRNTIGVGLLFNTETSVRLQFLDRGWNFFRRSRQAPPLICPG